MSSTLGFGIYCYSSSYPNGNSFVFTRALGCVSVFLKYFLNWLRCLWAILLASSSLLITGPVKFIESTGLLEPLRRVLLLLSVILVYLDLKLLKNISSCLFLSSIWRALRISSVLLRLKSGKWSLSILCNLTLRRISFFSLISCGFIIIEAFKSSGYFLAIKLSYFFSSASTSVLSSNLSLYCKTEGRIYFSLPIIILFDFWFTSVKGAETKSN